MNNNMKRKIEWWSNQVINVSLLWWWLQEGNIYAQNIVYFLVVLTAIKGIYLCTDAGKSECRSAGCPVSKPLYDVANSLLTLWVVAHGHWWVAAGMLFGYAMASSAYDSKPKEEK